MDVSNTQSTSRSNSRNSSNSEIEKELIELEISGNNNNISQNNHNTSENGNKNNTLKKRISSGKTPTRKAKRIRFYRNGDKFYTGILIPVSVERYKLVEICHLTFCTF